MSQVSKSGFTSTAQQNIALKTAIAKSRALNPQQFKNYSIKNDQYVQRNIDRSALNDAKTPTPPTTPVAYQPPVEVKPEMINNVATIDRSKIVQTTPVSNTGLSSWVSTFENTPWLGLAQFAQGVGNQGYDTTQILNSEYQDQSILNQSIGKAITGDLAGAGKLIADNPARFAGNLAFEIGTNFIPVGAALKVLKGTKVAKQVIDKAKKSEKFYQFSAKDDPTPALRGGTFWYSKEPSGYYVGKRVVDFGDQVFLREVDIPKKTTKSFEKLESDYYRIDNQALVPSGKFDRVKKAKISPVDKKTYDSTKKNITTSKERQELESARTYEQFQSFDEKKAKLNGMLDANIIRGKVTKNKPIGYVTNELSVNKKNEWAFPLEYTSKSKTIAGFGSKVSDKESLINRIVKPWNTSNKLANRAVKAGYNPKTDIFVEEYRTQQKLKAAQAARESSGQIKKASQLDSMQKAGYSGELGNIAGGLDDVIQLLDSTPKVQKVNYYDQFIADTTKVQNRANNLAFAGLAYNTARVGSTANNIKSNKKSKNRKSNNFKL